MQHGAAPHELFALLIKSSGDGNFAMLSVPFLQAFDTYQHLVVVADAHGFGDVALQVGAHGAVEACQPIGLIGENARQREDDEQGDVFRGQFHGDKDTEFILIPTNMVRLNNTFAAGNYRFSTHSLTVFSVARFSSLPAFQLRSG